MVPLFVSPASNSGPVWIPYLSTDNLSSLEEKTGSWEDSSKFLSRPLPISRSVMDTAQKDDFPGELQYIQYEHGLEAKYLPAIRSLISKDLSEPYSIYVYRYFLCQWAHLCFMALNPADSSLIGVIVCKLEVHAVHSTPTRRGYIAMLAVASSFRGHGIATALVKMAIDAMTKRNADEIVLETEETNTPAMRLYERLGFLRSKKLHRYYLNGNSAYRLVLPLKHVDPDADD